MTAYLYNAPAGVAGDVTRVDESNVEPAMLVTPFPTVYGTPMKYATGGITPMAASDAAAVFAGVLTRAAPGIGQDANQAFGDFTPNQKQPQGLMVRGYCNVLCTIGTPVRGGIVYVRVVAASGKFVGDFEATADSTNNVALVGVTWATDGKDASNNAEIRVQK